MPVPDLNRTTIVASLVLGMSCAAVAAPVVRMSPTVRSAAPAAAGADAVFVYPPGCYDEAGRPVNPDPANPGRSADPGCQPPSGTVVEGRRGPDGPIAPGETHMEPGSISRPPLPVPVPDGIGVIR